MKVQIAFYKAKGDWIDLAIRLWTNSIYSHCEIVSNKDWYSSSQRDGGVRTKQILNDGNSWDFIEVNIDKSRLYEIYRENKGKGYDFRGILFSNILPFKWHSKDKMTCSEFVASVLNYENPQKFSPKDIYTRLKNK